MATMSKKDAIKIIADAALVYSNELIGKNFLLVYKDKILNCIDGFEIAFLPRNFLHLTGLVYHSNNSVDFFNRCLNHSLSEKDFDFKTDGSTLLKLQALPKVMNFTRSSKMTATLSEFRTLLCTDKLVGNVHACLGFVCDGQYYVPNTCLLGDIRDIGKPTNQVVAILSKSFNKEACNYYHVVNYIAKGFDIETIATARTIRNLIRVDNT